MAIGFPPKFILDTPLDGLSPRHYLALSWYTIRSLNWEPGALSTNGLSAYTKGKDGIDSQSFTIEIEHYSALLTSRSLGFGFSDLGANEQNMDLYLNRYREVKAQVSEETLEQWYQQELLPLLENQRLNEEFDQGVKQNKLSGFMTVALPRPGYLATPFIVYTLLLLWLVQIFSGTPFLSPSSEQLISWGALSRETVVAGDYWRVFTSLFLYNGALNMIFLSYAIVHAGLNLEPLIGPYRIVFSFIFCGIAGNLLSLSYNDPIITCGPLAAISGLYGVSVAYLATGKFSAKSRPTVIAGFFVLFIWGMYGFYIKQQTIDFAAFIGAFVSGVIIGFAGLPAVIADNKARSIALYSVFAVALLAGIEFTASYEREIDRYAASTRQLDLCVEDTEMLTTLSQRENTDEQLETIWTRDGINRWARCKKEFQKLKLGDLPRNTQKEVAKTIELCDLNMEYFRMNIYSLSQPTEFINNKINELEQKRQNSHNEIMTSRSLYYRK